MTASLDLPPFLVRYVTAMNAHDSRTFVGCFAPDALVTDESHTYQGAAAIQGWIEGAFEKYAPHLEVTDLAADDTGVFFIGEVSGTFDGSPVLLKHAVSLVDGSIGALTIVA